jgi:flagellar motor switch protein FliM
VREVTEVEEEILKGVVQVICRELQATWQTVVAAEFQFDERQRQAQILRLMPPNEKILSLSFEIRMSTVSGMLVTAFPAVAANALIRKLDLQGSYRKHRVGSAEASTLREKLQKCCFPVELILPGGTVSSRELCALERGGILPLRAKAHGPAVLYVAKHGLFTAQPVRSGNRRAAQIVQKMGAVTVGRSENIDQRESYYSIGC